MHDRTAPPNPALPRHPAVPQQRDPRPDPSGAAPVAGHDGDPARAADAAATENLLRCWLREAGGASQGTAPPRITRPAPATPAPADGVLRIALPAAGAELRAPVLHWSATGHHRLGPARLVRHGHPDAPVTAPEIAGLLAGESAGHAPPPTGGPSDGAAPADPAGPDTDPRAPTGAGDDDLVPRVADSVRRTAAFLAARRHDPDPAVPDDAFLSAEQALVLGHPLHPTPKSRQGLDDAELRAYSPELRGSFPLHWLSADPSVTAQDSALSRGAAEVLADLAGPAAADVPPGRVMLPAHPRQVQEVADRPGTRELFDAGLLRDHGPAGGRWYPTSSVRTVYRPGAEAMLKLSLAVRITNSRRENLRKELHRGVEMHRLLASGLDGAWHAAHPGFDIVRDPAWLGIGADADTADGPGHGLDVMIRQNPLAPGGGLTGGGGLGGAPGAASLWCVAGLTALRPTAGGAFRSRLDEIVRALAARTGEPLAAVAAHWYRRYLDHVVRPVLWLDGEAGIALEAHQQNTLVLLDADGLPAGGRYRDNQGFYYRESHRAALEARLPGVGLRSDTFVADHVADERFAYYLALNNACGLVGAFGAQGLAAEPELLAVLREFLAAAARTGRSTLPERLLDSPRLRCKANLLTRLHGMDELVGPVETQSVYVTVENPVHAVHCGHVGRAVRPSAERSPR